MAKQIVEKKLAAPKGKTTRATMIALLLKSKGKVVSITAIKAAVKKLKGIEIADKKIAKRVPEVARFFKTHGLKFVKSGNGFKAA